MARADGALIGHADGATNDNPLVSIGTRGTVGHAETRQNTPQGYPKERFRAIGAESGQNQRSKKHALSRGFCL